MNNSEFTSSSMNACTDITSSEVCRIRVVEVDHSGNEIALKYTGAKLAKAFHESRVLRASHGAFVVQAKEGVNR